jgi:hypothetical protein
VTRMNTTDRDVWTHARNITDLAELTARWLEGRLPSTAGCQPECGLAPETDSIKEPLARLNRAGILTLDSQPGVPFGPGFDGALWQQKAAVWGFGTPETCALLAEFAERYGLLISYHRGGTLSWFSRLRDRFGLLPAGAITVSERASRPSYSYGTRVDLLAEFAICDPTVLDSLRVCDQITVADPLWGRVEFLWEVLDEFSESAAQVVRDRPPITPELVAAADLAGQSDQPQ